MLILDFIVDYDGITLGGVKVPRPGHVGAKEWLEFWEAISDVHDLRRDNEDLESKLEDALQEINDLKDEISALEEQVQELEAEDAE
jgi:hypothetical protein